MAQVNNAIPLRPSILDRLIDDEPGAEQGPLHRHFQDVRQLKRVVARDLEAMLNTRQEALEELPAEFAEVSRSLLTYGLPDYTSLNLLSVQDREYMRRALEQAVKLFEPRLKHVRVTLEPPRQYERQLRFRIEAVLPVWPAPEPVVFDAVLQLNTQDFHVRGQN
jgi:type VI secretion system protein ImpF